MELSKTLSAWAPRALGLTRLVFGLMFAQHGIQKLFQIWGYPGGPPQPGSQVWFGGWIELVGGFLIAAGLLTRFSAFIASGTMAVAYWQSHAPGGFPTVVNKGELAVAYCFFFLYLIFAGPGPWSLDALLAKRTNRIF